MKKLILIFGCLAISIGIAVSKIRFEMQDAKHYRVELNSQDSVISKVEVKPTACLCKEHKLPMQFIGDTLDYMILICEDVCFIKCGPTLDSVICGRCGKKTANYVLGVKEVIDSVGNVSYDKEWFCSDKCKVEANY